MAESYSEEPIPVPRFAESKGFYTTQKRSEQMAKIRAKNTKPELIFRKMLFAEGVRFRVNVKALPGTPDVAIKKYKIAIFIDGEFWHGKNWEKKKEKIKSNRDFWIPKIERNIQRDRVNNRQLVEMGYEVFRFWDTDIKKHPGPAVQEIVDYIAAVRHSLR